MASSSLLRIASSQLRLLSLRTGHKLTTAAEQSHRCCQDDSKQRKRNGLRPKAKDASGHDRKVVKAVGPAVNLLEKDLQDIFKEQQKQEKLKERSSLQCRIDLLLSVGCTMEQIQNKVKVLDLSEQTILHRATLLKDIGRSPITVNLLMSSYYTNSEMLRKFLQRRDKLDAATCTVLRCTLEELQQMKLKHVSLNRFRCLTAEDIIKKGKVLRSYGITSEEIKAFPEVLNIKVENIIHRLDTLKALREEGKVRFERYPLKAIAERTRSFEKCVRRALKGRAELDGSPITVETIAERLGVTAKDIEDASINFYKLGPSSALEKIDYLLGEGITNVEIVSHIYIMKYRIQTLRWAVKKSKSIAMSSSPSIYVLLSFLRSGCLPKKSFVWSRQRTYVASLLGVQMKELPGNDFLRPLWSTNRIFIKRNFDFLISEGFSVQDIFSCLVLLAHDPEHLEIYYHKLWERPEVVPHAKSVAWTEKRQTLSLLQYVMERDMNFSSAVFHADVELGQASAESEKESHDENSSREEETYEISVDEDD